jgi:hypothetical protein
MDDYGVGRNLKFDSSTCDLVLDVILDIRGGSRPRRTTRLWFLFLDLVNFRF